MKYFLLFLIFLVLPSFVVCTEDKGEKGEKMILSIDEVEKRASEEARRRGYDLSRSDVLVVDEEDDFWRSSIMKQHFYDTPELAQKIKGRKYFVVYYKRRSEPGKMILGGEIYVLVDKKTGEVLIVLTGK